MSDATSVYKAVSLAREAHRTRGITLHVASRNAASLFDVDPVDVTRRVIRAEERCETAREALEQWQRVDKFKSPERN